jgi:hypothetical protein
VIAQVGPETGGALVALNVADGKEKWKYSTPADGAAYSSPVLLTADGVKQVVAMTSKRIVGVGLADGKLLWEIPFVPAGMRGYNSATPIVDGATVIYTGGGRGTFAVKVEKKGEAFVATELWKNADLAGQFCTPVLHDGLLFGMTDDGRLFCLDAKTGKAQWTDTTKRPNFGALVDAGAVIVLLTSDGQLVAFKPVGTGYEEVAKIKVAESAAYAHPVISGTQVFVRDQDSLLLLTLD